MNTERGRGRKGEGEKERKSDALPLHRIVPTRASPRRSTSRSWTPRSARPSRVSSPSTAAAAAEVLPSGAEESTAD